MSREDMLAAFKNPAQFKKAKPSRKKEVAADSKYTAEEKAKMDAEGAGLSGAVKEWGEKFKEMKDSEFWIALCFESSAQLATFSLRAGLGVAEHDMVLGEKLIEALGVDMSIEEPPHKRMTKFRVDKAEIKRQLHYQPHPDPLAGVIQDGPLELVAQAEMDALAAALRAGSDSDWLATHGGVDDTDHWVAFAFDSRKVKDKFLRLSGWDTVGDKYLDGRKVATVLGFAL